MTKNLFILLMLISLGSCHRKAKTNVSQKIRHSTITTDNTSEKSIIANDRAFQRELASFYKGKQSPIRIDNRKDFKGITFFPIDINYHIKADFKKINEKETVHFATTTTEKQTFIRYGVLDFMLKGKKFRLILYQSLPVNPNYADELFLPFKDLTNGSSSYGGGRYLGINRNDIKSNQIILDFNRAYNPYCAYEPSYSCPLVPKENNLKIAIKAGVSYKATH